MMIGYSFWISNYIFKDKKKHIVLMLMCNLAFLMVLMPNWGSPELVSSFGISKMQRCTEFDLI